MTDPAASCPDVTEPAGRCAAAPSRADFTQLTGGPALGWSRNRSHQIRQGQPVRTDTELAGAAVVIAG
jgi:hypothetical protein